MLAWMYRHNENPQNGCLGSIFINAASAYLVDLNEPGFYNSELSVNAQRNNSVYTDNGTVYPKTLVFNYVIKI